MNEKVKQALGNVKNIKVGTMVLNDLFWEDLKVIETAFNDYDIQNKILKEQEKELIKVQHELFDIAKDQEKALKIIAKTCRCYLKEGTYKQITFTIYDNGNNHEEFELVKKVVEKYGK